MVAWIWPRTCSGGGDAEASTDEVASAEGSGCAVGRDATAGREAVTCADGVADVPVVWAAGEVRNWVSITAATPTPAPAAPRASIPPRVVPAPPRRRTPSTRESDSARTGNRRSAGGMETSRGRVDPAVAITVRRAMIKGQSEYSRVEGKAAPPLSRSGAA